MRRIWTVMKHVAEEAYTDAALKVSILARDHVEYVLLGGFVVGLILGLAL